MMKICKMTTMILWVMLLLSACSGGGGGGGATLVSIGVTPASPSIANGTSEQFTATGVYSDHTTADITAQASWSSSNTSVATIDTTGKALAAAAGTTTITASLGSVSGTDTLTVTDASLVSISVTPADPSIAKGTTKQFTATGTFGDGSTQDLTTQAAWNSSDTAVAMIDAAGRATGLAKGAVTITATFGSISGTTALTVTNAVLSSIAVTPANPTIAKGATKQFTATGSFTDATTQDLTTQATWTTSDATKATVTSSGLAAGAGVGSGTISATVSGITGSTTLTVTNASLVSIGVSPAGRIIPAGIPVQYSATGVYTDNSTQDVTSLVTWSTSTNSVSISNANGSKGLAVAAGAGQVIITATDPATQIAGGANAAAIPMNVSAGYQFTVRIKPDNTLWTWGRNNFGELGNEDSTLVKQTSPVEINTSATWQFLAPGLGYQAIALKGDGTLWSWGYNAWGQLGIASNATLTNSPSQVGTDAGWQYAAVGYGHAVGVKRDGTLWTWGNNGAGQLGDGTTSNGADSPAQVGTDVNWLLAAAGNDYTLAIKNNGTLWAWGNNNYGQLGIASSTTSTNVPVQVGTDANWQSVAAGYAYTAGVKTDGTLWAWGYNGYGQFGNGTTSLGSNTPVRIGSNSNWRFVAAGYQHTVGIQSDGTLWAWGNNALGQLGDGTTVSHYVPAQIGTDTDWVYVAAGDYHTIAMKADGTVYAWGFNYYGQLGIGASGEDQNRLAPAQMGTDSDWASFAAGRYHAVAQKTGGALYAWGWNVNGQVGDGTLTDRPAPVSIGTGTYMGATGGGSHSLAKKNDGTLWAWGYNGYGQLGDGTGTDQHAPEQIGTDTDWETGSAGMYHSALIKANGTLWAWGYNYYGQLGIASSDLQVSSPTQAGSDTDWRLVSAGDEHTVAIKTNNTLWTWGDNSYGQLGIASSITSTSSPVQVGTDTNWQTVASGNLHIAAVKTDGTLWTWGWNAYGQLGDGTSTDSNAPQQIGTGTNWKIVAAGYDHTVALKTDGTLWAWGYNGYGQLGDGTTNSETSPVQVGTDTNWTQVAAGFDWTMAMKTDGTLWAWGSNYYGQLGIGTSGEQQNRNTPTIVP